MDRPIFKLFSILFILGILFRLVWTADMEWKSDEKRMHSLARTSVGSGTLPAVGMESGVGLPNPGFSVWPFAAVYALNKDPIFMAKAVQWANVLALLIFIFCALRIRDNKNFLFGLALFSVNLLAVLFSRKIWAQDLIPLFSALVWLAHLYRHKLIAVFCWGLLSALMGQLHLSGFDYGLGLFAAALLYRQFSGRSFVVFCAGFIIGLLPAIAWIFQLPALLGNSTASWSNILKLEYWMHALIDPLGINVVYPLGADASVFIKQPLGLYIPVLLALGIAGIFIAALVLRIKRSGRSNWRDLRDKPEVFYFIAFVCIPGMLLTLSGTPVRSHYLIGAAPFLHIALMKFLGILGDRSRWVLISLQACITAMFLYFVHTQKTIRGDYGTPYRQQQEEVKK